MADFQFLDLLSGEHGWTLFRGLWMTLALTVCCWVMAIAGGMVLASARESGVGPLAGAGAVFVAYHRNTPLLVQVMFWYFGIATLFPTTWQAWINGHGGGLIPGSIALILCMAAYMGEDVRSGLRAVASGQLEAARASGLSFVQAYRHVVLPQALRTALPALTGRTVSLFKGTSVLMAVGVAELTYAVKLIDAETYRTFAIFAIGSVAYLAISLGLMALGYRIEKALALK